MSLLAWYPLIANGNNQGLDGIDLTSIGTITYTAGKLGNAPTFTQNLANRFRRPQIKIKDNFSFACWFKLDTTESTTWQTLLFEGRDVNSDGWGFRINGSNKRLIYCCGSSTWTYGTDLTMGQWYHATMVVKDGVYTAYLNGNQVNTATITTLPALTEWGTYFYVSCLSDNYYPLMGQVQDVRIYDHPLSKKEVKEISKGLCLHLPMSWGGNPNMIKLSYTFMNKSAGSSNQWTNSGLTYDSSTVTENDTAPCRWVMKRVITNTKTSNVGGAGCFYVIGAKGLATTDLTENEYYTYSFWAKSDSGVPSGLGAGAVVEGQTLVSNTGFGELTGNWRLHTVTFKWTKTTSLTNCFYITVPASSTVDFQVCGMKLEKGQKATPYIPHVNETAYTEKGFGVNYKDECSGYNRTVTVNSNNTIGIATDSPRGTGTNITKSGKLTISNCMPIGTFPMFTVNAWIRTKSDTTYTLWYDFFGISATTNTDSNSLFRMEISNTAGTAFNWYGPMADAGGLFNKTISTDTWYMVTLVSDGTKFIGYLNGVQYATKTPDTDARKGWKTTGNFYVGDTNIWFDVADVRVYSTVLSVDDIKELYQIPVQIDKTGKIYCNNLVEA